MAASLLCLVARPLAAQCPDGTPPPCGPRPAARATPPPNSIAVLPFSSRSPDSADAYLAEAMTEEIANRLTQAGRLQVKARGVVASLWRRAPDAYDAARQLGVTWFVHGNVRRIGGQLAVNVELVRATTSEEVWATRFARRDMDLFAIQAEVAESVAVTVRGRLTPEERRTIGRRATANPEAWRLYLLGNTLLRRRPNAQRAFEAYAAAVRLDSGFAAGWARMGYVRAIQHSGGAPESTLVAARIYAIRALALDSSSADAWGADAMISSQEEDYGRFHAACVRALALDTLNAENYHTCGILHGLSSWGVSDNPERSESLFRRALALDPDLQNTWRLLGWLKAAQGLLAEAEALYDTSLSLGPYAASFVQRAQIRLARGNTGGALADLAEFERMVGRQNERLSALIRVSMGDSAPARALLETSRIQADSGAPDYAGIAILSAALGLREEALSALERRGTARDPNEPRCAPATPCSTNLGLWRLLHSRLLISLRSEPRVQRLLEETRPRVPWRR